MERKGCEKIGEVENKEILVCEKKESFEEKVRNNYGKWKEENDVKDQMRLDDYSFHNYLGFDKETGEFGIYTESGNTYTEGIEYVYEFTNGQDVANMDSTDYQGFFLTRECLERADIPEEKIKKILKGKEEIAFDDFDCDDDFNRFLKKLEEEEGFSEEETDNIRDYAEGRVLEKFLEDGELEEMDEAFEKIFDGDRL